MKLLTPQKNGLEAISFANYKFSRNYILGVLCCLQSLSLRIKIPRKPMTDLRKMNRISEEKEAVFSV